ncbi:zinc finger CCCH domain-containing protein 13-like [Lingula anatina]|nr:zinc finger CCCH domain-containing protein 13-like [Lingula anatina]|eukprot:XP_013390755.1 zinc finger CCCH domain-containing protein 13-like [Lingula anatina]
MSPPAGGSTEGDMKDLPPDVSANQEGEDKQSTAGGNLEYDEISDNELDEILATEEAEQEEESAPAPVDILDIDWRSLIAEKVPKPEVKKSAVKRFSPASVFASIGVSRALAGEQLYNKIIRTCQEQLEQEAAEEAAEAPEGSTEEPKTSQREHPKFALLNDVAAFHATAVQRRRERAKLLTDLDSYKRALSARHDLQIRRKLCKFDKASELSSVFPAPVHDPELYKQSLQILRHPRGARNAAETPLNITA